MERNKRVIVLGGGYGGVLTALHLARGIKRRGWKQVRVTLIDQNPFHTMLTELHEVAAGRVGEKAVRMDLEEIFHSREVAVIQDRITRVSLEDRALVGERDSYYYDYLVVAAGSRPTYYDTPGAELYAHPLWSYRDAMRLRAHIRESFSRAYREPDPAKRREHLTFVVAGAGFTGVEMAGELGEALPGLCEAYHVPREEVRICLVDLADRILPALPEKLAAKAARRLRRLGVELLLETAVEEVGESFALLSPRGAAGGGLPARTVIWTAGVEGGAILESISTKKQGRGRIETDSTLRAKGASNVYAVGDNLFYTPKGAAEPVPQMVENAELSARTAARNLLCDLAGEPGGRREYQPRFHGMMVSVGGRWGIAWVGTEKHKLALTGFFALFAKHLVNLVYFMQVLGLQKALSYLRAEVFQIRDRRSLVGGHLARNAPNFWTVPLRMFLGVMWLLEFWSKWPKLVEDPTRIFLFHLPGADGIASATVEASVEAVGAAAYGTALPVPSFLAELVQWSMEVFVAPVAPFAQAALIMAELLFGLALLAGCFTAPVSLLSAGMCVMIYLSGMAGKEILWFFFAGIASVGSGSAFSFDYYLLPRVKRWWNRLEMVEKMALEGGVNQSVG